MAALSEHENLEPGSDLWIARQAYLKVMEKDIQQNNFANLILIQARYKALQQVIIFQTFSKAFSWLRTLLHRR